MPQEAPQVAPKEATVICTYRVRSGQEEAFRALLERHWPTLRELGLATAEPPQVFLGRDSEGRPTITEIFSWVDAQAPKTAHESPEVMSVWEPMGALCEARDGRPSMEFPHVERMALAFQGA